MQFTQSYIVCLLVLLCFHDIKADVNLNAKISDEEFSLQNELKEVSATFNDTSFVGADGISQLLKLIRTDETSSFQNSSKLVYYVPDRIKLEGYPVEVHEVVTDDGYILNLFRIPFGKKSPQTEKPKPPVLLGHALVESANSFIALGQEKSLAYLLADAGYDVWLANARGTNVSSRHVRLKSTGWWQKEYWSFSLHELGVYDLPAFIDYILVQTNRTKLNYVGLSQGATQFFILNSMRPEYNDKFIEAHLMGPAAFVKEIRMPLFSNLLKHYTFLKRTLKMLRIYKIQFDHRIGVKFAEWACKNDAFHKFIMKIIDSDQIDCETLPSIAVNTPDVTAVRILFHFAQNVRTDSFRRFDYENKRINRQKYGQNTPPSYDLSKITAPINLYYSKYDDLITIESIIKLQAHLKSIKSNYSIPLKGFNHVDFTYSRYVREAVYDKIISNINVSNGL